MNIAKAEKPSRINFALRVLDGFSCFCCLVIKMAQTDNPLAPSNIVFIFPAKWIFRRVKSLDLCGLQSAKTEWVI